MIEQRFFTTEDVIHEQAASILADFYALYEMEQYKVFGDRRDAFASIQEKLEERLQRSILTMASLARANDDAGDGFRIHEERRPGGVGSLIEGNSTSLLKAREACNKIIHAETARFELVEEAGVKS